MDSEALSQFINVTGATADAAKFFLESANGDVGAAVDQYFTSGGQAQQEESVPAPAARQQAAAPTAISPASANAASEATSRKPAAGDFGSSSIARLLRLISAFAAAAMPAAMPAAMTAAMTPYKLFLRFSQSQKTYRRHS